VPEAPVSLATTLIGIVLTGGIGFVVALASALLCRRLWAVDRWMAVPCGLAGLAVASMVTFFAWLPGPMVGRLVDLLLLLGSAAVCLRPLLGREGRTAARAAIRRALPVALLTGGLLLVTLGLTFLWSVRADLFTLSAIRFSHQLPWDNELQAIISNRLADGLDPRGQLSSWLTSDRPPLQSGFQLLTVPPLEWLPLSRSAALAQASVAVQLVWVPAAYALSRQGGFTPRSSLLACAFAGLSGTALINTVFTWPKVVSAGFLVAALALALRYRRAPRTGEAVVLALLTAGGLLSHGSGVFFLPVLVAALLWRRVRIARLRYLGIAAVTVVVAYLPWVAYQRFYDPPGDRLLYYSLAGVQEIVHEPFLAFLRHRYAEAGWSETIDNKLANLWFPVSHSPFAGFSTGGFDAFERRTSEFFVLSTAVGAAILPLLAVFGVAAVAVLRRRRASRQVRTIAGLAIACVGSWLIWALLLWGPGTTVVHVSPLAQLWLLFVLPTAWVTRVRPVFGWLLLALQATLLLMTYVRSGETLAGGALVALVLGGLVVVLAILAAPDREAVADPAAPSTDDRDRDSDRDGDEAADVDADVPESQRLAAVPGT
jgi:hypothetical protein